MTWKEWKVSRRILVTGAGGSAGINFVASLRMAASDLYIVGTDINAWHLELPDVDAAYLLPHCTEPDYIPTLKRLIALESIELLHAQPDMEVEVISAHRDDLGVRTFLPPHESILLCHDKMATNRRLREAGVPVPRSGHVQRLADIPAILEELGKPGQKVWLRATRGAGSRAALPVHSVRQAKEWIHYWRSTGRLETKDFMMSEFLPGGEFAFQSVWVDGELYVSQARERLEYIFGNLTPSGQSSSPSVARTVHRADVNRVATAAVRAVCNRPHGVFCVDLKENSDGVPCVTEINIGRFFTTSNFFATAGVNMPYLSVELAFGRRPPSPGRYDPLPEGLYWIRLMDKGPVMVGEGTFRARKVPNSQ